MAGYHDSNTPVEVRQKWQTPPGLFRALEVEYAGPHGFGLDAAAGHDNHLVGAYITEAEDSLRTDWLSRSISGRPYVWLNPPYANIGPWVEKATREAFVNGLTVVMLVPAATDTVWFNNAMIYASECIFLQQRVKFVRADTKEPGPAGKTGSAVIIFRPGCFHYGKESTRFRFLRTQDLLETGSE